MLPRKKAWFPVLVVMLALIAPAGPRSMAGTPATAPEGPVVIRLYFGDRQQLDAVAGELDIWESHLADGYVVAYVKPDQYEQLASLGYAIEIDAQKTEQLGIEAALDPRYYYFDDYFPNPNGLYIVDFLHDINAAYPDLTELFDAGNAWLADHGGHARDMWVLRVTNEDPAYGPIEQKPVFFLMAQIHAREVATPELAMRYVRYLLSGYNGQGGYGVDPDATWLVDNNVLYVLVMQNPDGHVVNEQDIGNYRRKNLDSDDGCFDPSSWGVDLNRNHSFLWGCCGGSSSNPCSETYRGPAAGSEPETAAFQEFFAQVVPDQNGPNGDNEVPPAAPDDATGIFISLHSYSDVILWSWYLPGYPPAPNQDQMENIGRKFAYYNGYDPSGTIGYTVDGSSDYWTYGKFGIASFTIEVGSSGGSCGGFFPAYGCLDGIDGMPRSFWAENLPVFLYAHKIAATPYMTSYGPDTESVTASPGVVSPGTPVQVGASVADHRYGGDPLQPIGAAEYFIGTPGEDGSGTPLEPVDGSWGGMTEQVTAILDTSGLPVGRHLILVHGQNTSGDWGPFSAAFLYVMEPGVSPTVRGYVRDGSTNAPLAATVTAGSFQTATDPETGFYSMMVISGTYDISAEAVGFAPTVVHDVPLHDYTVVEQDFYMAPYCALFGDDVESGNIGWTPDAPWAITDEAFHSPTHSWTDSPGSNYGNNLNISLTSPPLDLSSATGVSLNFWHIYDLQYFWDYGYVDYSTNGGGTWTTAASYSQEEQLEWTQETIPLPSLDSQPNARIRFRLKTNSYVQEDGWHIDDIVVTGASPVCIVPTPPVAEFSSNSPVGLGEPVSFINQTSGTPPFDYFWDFGDGVGTSTEFNPEYTYQHAGTFTVTLVATNAQGTDTISHPVRVEAASTSYLPVIVLNP